MALYGSTVSIWEIVEDCGDLFTPRKPLCPVENLEDEMPTAPQNMLPWMNSQSNMKGQCPLMPDYFLLKDCYTDDSSNDYYNLESDETQDWVEEDGVEVNQNPGAQEKEERSLPERSGKRCKEEGEEGEE